jgi:hypothetical protein
MVIYRYQPAIPKSIPKQTNRPRKNEDEQIKLGTQEENMNEQKMSKIAFKKNLYISVME